MGKRQGYSISDAAREAGSGGVSELVVKAYS
jgi:hypothetical protein